MRRSFVDTLRDLRGGELIEQLDTSLQELVQAVQTTGGGGQVVLTIVVAPTKGAAEAVVVKDTVKLKKPEIKSAGTLMPEQIVLSIPVFENEAPAELHARLRYRVKDGQLAIWYELIRPHKVLEAAFRTTWKRIEDEAQAVILLGSPE